MYAPKEIATSIGLVTMRNAATAGAGWRNPSSVLTRHAATASSTRPATAHRTVADGAAEPSSDSSAPARIGTGWKVRLSSSGGMCPPRRSRPQSRKA